MKLEKIIPTAEALKNFVEVLKDAEADARAIAALCALNEDFRDNMETLKDILYNRTQTNVGTEKTNTNTTSSTPKKIPLGFESTPKPPEPTEWQAQSTVEIIPVTDVVSAEPDGYFKIPDRDDVVINKEGNILFKTNEGWVPGIRETSNGYVSAHAPKGCESSRVNVAFSLLKTFIGFPADTTGISVEYQNNNRYDIRFENIRWGKARRYGPRGFDEYTVREICTEICNVVRENKSLTKAKLMKALGAKNLVSNKGLESILTGKYSEISSEYFAVKDGMPVLNNNKFDELVADFAKKVETIPPTKMQAEDLVIPILQHIRAKDGSFNTYYKVRELIYHTYGKRFFISKALIDDVRNKKFCKDICDLVF